MDLITPDLELPLNDNTSTDTETKEVLFNTMPHPSDQLNNELTKDHFTDHMLSNPFPYSLEVVDDGDDDENGNISLMQTWQILKKNDALSVNVWKIVFEYIRSEWIIIDKNGNKKAYLDYKSITGSGMYLSDFGSKNSPDSIFQNGVDSYWPIYSSQCTAGLEIAPELVEECGYVAWNFSDPIAIYECKVRAEEYSDYGHFASEIHLYCGMDETHQKYDYAIKLVTKQCGGWQYFYDLDRAKVDNNTFFVMKGKYWRLHIHKMHGNTYGEIAQIDFKGYVL